jgi:hypothetical protein
MAVNYLQDYLGIDPNDYSAMEQGIAGISPLAPGQSIIPQAPVMPKASIMSEDDFAGATAPLMNRVYQREAEGRERAEGLTNELQALQAEMAQTSEAEIQKRADLEKQIQNIMQERDVSRNFAEDLENQIQGIMEELGVSRSEAENLAGQLETTTQERDASMQSAEGLATELQDVQANLAEITQLRDTALQNYQDAVAQQDIIRQQAAENQAIQLEEQRNSLLAEREGIITTLEQDFGVQRSELESVIGGLEGQVGDLTSKVGELESVRGSLESQINDLSSQMQSLEVEKQDALAQQDVIRAESAQAQQDALAQQGEQFATEKSALEQQIADLTAQVGQQQPPAETPTVTDIQDGPPLSYQEFIEAGNAPIDYNAYRASFGDNTQIPPQLPPKIDMPPATGEGGLPEGYSYKPGPGSEGFYYTTVMPTPGYRYAYGPDGDRIEVPDNRTGGTGGVPIAKPYETIVKPPQVPPKSDDFMSIERIGNTGGGKVVQDLGPLPPGAPVDESPSIGGPVEIPGGPILTTGREELERNNPILPVQKTFLPIANPRNPSMFEEIEKKIAEAGGSKITYPTQTAKPIFQKTPKMAPPQKPMSIGGVGGRSSGRRMRPTFRAGGGAIGQAIADLQNRLR